MKSPVLTSLLGVLMTGSLWLPAIAAMTPANLARHISSKTVAVEIEIDSNRPVVGAATLIRKDGTNGYFITFDRFAGDRDRERSRISIYVRTESGLEKRTASITGQYRKIRLLVIKAPCTGLGDPAKIAPILELDDAEQYHLAAFPLGKALANDGQRMPDVAILKTSLFPMDKFGNDPITYRIREQALPGHDGAPLFNAEGEMVGMLRNYESKMVDTGDVLLDALRPDLLNPGVDTLRYGDRTIDYLFSVGAWNPLEEITQVHLAVGPRAQWKTDAFGQLKPTREATILKTEEKYGRLQAKATLTSDEYKDAEYLYGFVSSAVGKPQVGGITRLIVPFEITKPYVDRPARWIEPGLGEPGKSIAGERPLIRHLIQTNDCEIAVMNLPKVNLHGTVLWSADKEFFYVLQTKGSVHKIRYTGLVEVARYDFDVRITSMTAVQDNIVVYSSQKHFLYVLDRDTLTFKHKFGGFRPERIAGLPDSKLLFCRYRSGTAEGRLVDVELGTTEQMVGKNDGLPFMGNGGPDIPKGYSMGPEGEYAARMLRGNTTPGHSPKGPYTVYIYFADMPNQPIQSFPAVSSVKQISIDRAACAVFASQSRGPLIRYDTVNEEEIRYHDFGASKHDGVTILGMHPVEPLTLLASYRTNLAWYHFPYPESWNDEPRRTNRQLLTDEQRAAALDRFNGKPFSVERSLPGAVKENDDVRVTLLDINSKFSTANVHILPNNKTMLMIDDDGMIHRIRLTDFVLEKSAWIRSQAIWSGLTSSGLALMLRNRPELIVVDTDSFETIQTLPAMPSKALASSPNSPYIFGVTDSDETIRFQDVTTGRNGLAANSYKTMARAVEAGHFTGNRSWPDFDSVMVSPDGKNLYAGMNKSQFKFDIKNGKLAYAITTVKHKGAAIFSCGNRYIAVRTEADNTFSSDDLRKPNLDVDQYDGPACFNSDSSELITIPRGDLRAQQLDGKVTKTASLPHGVEYSHELLGILPSGNLVIGNGKLLGIVEW